MVGTIVQEEREEMGNFCTESERVRSLKRRRDSFVLLCMNGFYACVAPLFKCPLFHMSWPCSLDLESFLPFLGINAIGNDLYFLFLIYMHAL